MSDAPQLKKTLIIGYIRAIGAILMLAGVAFVFNLAGIASGIGLTDGLTAEVIGGVLFVTGIADFFILPVILAKKLGG